MMKTNRRKFIRNSILGTAGIVFGLSLGKKYINSVSASKVNIDNLKDLIISVSGTIIPKDDTPGMEDSNIFDYIKYVSKNILKDSEKNKLILGFLELTNIADNQFGKTFQRCSYQERITILQDLQTSKKNNKIIKKIRHKVLGKNFIEMITSLTIECYCTSEVGCKNFFQYDIIPVNFNPSIDIDDKFPAWATK